MLRCVLLCALLVVVTGQDLAPRRPKRYLVFPEGSTFSFAFCMTIKAITPDFDIFSEAVAVAVSYELPFNSTTLGFGKPPQHVVSRSERSAIYSKVETILEKLGIPGAPCILRAICEGAQQLLPGDGMLTEILRTLLLFPEQDAYEDEPKHHWRYLAARRAGLLDYNCPDLYPQCPISFVDIFTSLRPIVP